jgi:hypothetical protein
MKTKEFVIRYIDKDLDEYLVSKGFFPIKRGIFENIDGSCRILIDDGIKCISMERSSVYSDELVEFQLSFIPEIPVLEYILKGIYFIK